MDFIPRERHCNMVEAALPPSARDRPVSAVRKKNTLHGPCHYKVKKKRGCPKGKTAFLLKKTVFLLKNLSNRFISVRLLTDVFFYKNAPHAPFRDLQDPDLDVFVGKDGIDIREAVADLDTPAADSL